MRAWRVRFIEVGRTKRTWERTFPGPELDADAVAREAGTALKSRGVDVTIDLDTGTGLVFAGAHTVGRLEVLPVIAA